MIKNNKEYLSRLVNSVPALLSYVDKNQKYCFVNNNYLKWFDKTSEQIIGKTVKDILGENAYVFVRPHIKKALGGEVAAYKATIPYKDGTMRDIHATYTPDFADDNSVQGFFVSVEDITAFQKHEARYQALVDNSPFCIYEIDENKTFLSMNHSGLGKLGIKKEQDVIGMRYLDVVHTKDRDRVGMHLDQVFSGKTVSFEFLSIDGKAHYRSSMTPLANINGVQTIMGMTEDMTQYRRSEEDLRELEIRHDLALRGLSVGIWDWNVQTNELFWSNRFKEIVGVSEKSFKPHFDEFGDRLHPDDKEATLKAVDAHLKGKAPYDVEYRLKHNQGHYVWIHACGQAVWDQNGNPVRMVGSVDDISEKKSAELAIKQVAAKMKAIVDNTVDGIITINDKGIVESFNLACENIFGYKAEEVIGKNVNTLMPEPYRKEHNSYLRNYHNTIEKKIIGIGREVEGQRKDGTVMPLDLSISEVELGDRKIYSGIVRDISDKKESERELVERKTYLDTLVENIPSMVFVKEAGELRFTQFNKAGEKLLGIDRNKMIGKNDHDFFPKEQADFFTSVDREVLESGKLRIVEEEDINTKSGKRILRTKKVPITLPGDKKFLLGISEDITEHKKAEEKNKQFIDELSKSNIDLERFAYIVSHDLREPLRGISYCTQLLEQELQNTLSQKETGFMDAIQDGIHRMTELIDNLLVYSKLNTSTIPFVTENCNEILELALQNMSLVITETSAKITYDNLPDIIGDKIQLTQLFQNLISNAIKYHSNKRPINIHISAKEKQEQWVISVRDNGKGIEEKYLEDIFTVFKRLESRSEYPGSGIGLAICRKVIENHRGKIWAESDFGEGSIFYFTLPKANIALQAA